MTNDAPKKQSFKREAVAQFLESINDEIARHPERHSYLTPVQRAMWAGFPAQARAHRYPWVILDPDHPILDYMLSGRIGPNYVPTKSATQEQTCR